MGKPWDKREFVSWERALESGKLGSDQIETLDRMVAAGEAQTRKEAAQRLDWLDTVLDPDEHMYGF